ncbi:MAG: cobalamin biosynthesis protein [Desulfuromonadales bacterium]
MTLAIIAITPGGAALARRLAEALPEATVHLPDGLRTADGCRYFDQPLATLLPRLFAEGRDLVCIMATGIVVRLLATHLRGKATDPAVVVMDEAGRFAVSLLSGHLGGANALALELARISGGTPVITTATDVNGLIAWDEAARREGFGVEPVAHIKTLNALLLRGEKIALVDRRGRLAGYFAEAPGMVACNNFAEALRSAAGGSVFVTHRLIPNLSEQKNLLLLRPRDLVVGIGCNRGTTAEEIETAVTDTLHQAFLSPLSIANLATIDAKADETGLNEFAARHGWRIEHHSAEALNGVPLADPPSPHVLAAVGAQGVCEPAALLSASSRRLLVKKRKHGNVTVAVAEKS